MPSWPICLVKFLSATSLANVGNKITRVTPTLIGVGDKWTARINPPQYEILPDSENTFTFAIIPPFDFGWHNEFGTFEIQFLSEVYPYRKAILPLETNAFLAQ